MKISTALLALTLATSLIACGKSSKKSSTTPPAPKKELASLAPAATTETTEAKPNEEVKVEEAKAEDVVIVVREISSEEVALSTVATEAAEEVKIEEKKEEANVKAEADEGLLPRQEEILVIKDTCKQNQSGEGSLAMVQKKKQIAPASFLDNDCKVPTQETAEQAAR